MTDESLPDQSIRHGGPNNKGLKALGVIFAIIAIVAAFSLGYGRATHVIAQAQGFHLDFPANTTGKSSDFKNVDKMVVINLYKLDSQERQVQPKTVSISTNRITNKGSRPYKIKLSLVGCDYPVRWVTNHKDWDEARKTFVRTIRPGKSVDMTWRITIPEDVFEYPVVLDGGIAVIDDETGGWIGYIPVKIINSEDGTIPGSDVCCP